MGLIGPEDWVKRHTEAENLSLVLGADKCRTAGNLELGFLP
jgi:hypothetical protein